MRNKTDSHTFINRELSWLAFARRVLAMAESSDVPLLERVKFAGIVAMLHDEFFMKRMSGLKRQMSRQSSKLSLDGRTPIEEYHACRDELGSQAEALTAVIESAIRPALTKTKLPIIDHDELGKFQKKQLRRYFKESVMPILTPLAVDLEHPFPFISNLGLNIGVWADNGDRRSFIRIKVPANRPRWVPLADGMGFTPLEQIIAANLDLLFPQLDNFQVHLFRVTRGADGETTSGQEHDDTTEAREPGSIVRQVSSELKARKFAGAVRLQTDAAMSDSLVEWLAQQIGVTHDDIYSTAGLLALADLSNFKGDERSRLRFSPHLPQVHPRLVELEATSAALFEEIRAGDLLLHHPYHDFDASVGRFILAAAGDPEVLAIKLTIYRTSKDSPIVRALAEAAKRGKQVAVLVEITARFDEAPNIAWGKYLENEGVHVSYGVKRLKTHVKLCLVVREEEGSLQRYAHVGTGNYHGETARIYEDVGVLTANAEICDDVARVFNSLTSATPHRDYQHMLVAPLDMRERFTELIRQEALNARAGKPSGIRAKMNQLQDPQLIRELYAASGAGVPIDLIVRGLCCLRPGVPGLSETIRVTSVIGRFLEHSRIYRFENDSDPVLLLGSADWMKRNLTGRVETIMPILDEDVREELERLLDVYNADNSSAWDCDAEGVYRRRCPEEGKRRHVAQEVFIRRAAGKRDTPPGKKDRRKAG